VLQARLLTARSTGRHIQGDPVIAFWWTLKTCCVATNKSLFLCIFLEHLYQAMEFLVNICALSPFIDYPQYRQTHTGWSSISLLMNPEDMLCSHEQVSVAMYISWTFIPSHGIFSQYLCSKPVYWLPAVHIDIYRVIYVLLTVHLASVLLNNQLDAQFLFRICLFQFSTCSEHPLAHHQENPLY